MAVLKQGSWVSMAMQLAMQQYLNLEITLASKLNVTIYQLDTDQLCKLNLASFIFVPSILTIGFVLQSHHKLTALL